MLELFRKLFALPPGASSFADGVDSLHLVVIAITLLGAAGIALLAAFFIVRYRKEARAGATPFIIASTARESLIVGGILLLFSGFWLVGFRQYLRMQRPPADARRVYVTAKQWMWKFTYEDGRSAGDVLTVEQGVPVELLMTSRDVIHSFFVPAFRAKRDVVPGRYVSVWFRPVRSGDFPIFCAEYCGVSHSNMAGVVRVLDAKSYARWLQLAEPEDSQTLSSAGRDAAIRHACFACHTIDGQPRIGPTWRGLYGASVELASGQRVTADAAYLTRSMMEPSADLVLGYPDVMPPYFGSLSQPETAAILEYIRTLANVPLAASVSLPKVVPLVAGGAEPVDTVPQRAEATP